VSRLIEALKLTGRRRFAQRAVASCRYAAERQRERTSLSGRCLFGFVVRFGSWLFSNPGRALALPAALPPKEDIAERNRYVDPVRRKVRRTGAPGQAVSCASFA